MLLFKYMWLLSWHLFIYFFMLSATLVKDAKMGALGTQVLCIATEHIQCGQLWKQLGFYIVLFISRSWSTSQNPCVVGKCYHP